MIIIALEGLDKSGKASNSRLLADALTNEGYRVVQSEFHRYDTPTGDLIGKWLRKEVDYDQTTIELIMAADKQAQQRWFEELEMDGVDVLILDRYTMSQWVYSQANGVNTVFALNLQSYMRQPDHTIILDIPSNISMSRKGKHNNGINDRYEEDKALLDKVRKLYLEYSHGTNDIVIDATKPIEEIQQEIVSFVLSKLPTLITQGG